MLSTTITAISFLAFTLGCKSNQYRLEVTPRFSVSLSQEKININPRLGIVLRDLNTNKAYVTDSFVNGQNGVTIESGSVSIEDIFTKLKGVGTSSALNDISAFANPYYNDTNGESKYWNTSYIDMALNFEVSTTDISLNYYGTTPYEGFYVDGVTEVTFGSSATSILTLPFEVKSTGTPNIGGDFDDTAFATFHVFQRELKASYMPSKSITNNISFLNHMNEEILGSNGSYKNGYDTGYSVGYNDGYSSGSALTTTPGFYNVFSNLFTSMGGLLKTEVFPNFTLGALFGIPLICCLVLAVLKLFR